MAVGERRGDRGCAGVRRRWRAAAASSAHSSTPRSRSVRLLLLLLWLLLLKLQRVAVGVGLRRCIHVAHRVRVVARRPAEAGGVVETRDGQRRGLWGSARDTVSPTCCRGVVRRAPCGSDANSELPAEAVQLVLFVASILHLCAEPSEEADESNIGLFVTHNILLSGRQRERVERLQISAVEPRAGVRDSGQHVSFAAGGESSSSSFVRGGGGVRGGCWRRIVGRRRGWSHRRVPVRAFDAVARQGWTACRARVGPNGRGHDGERARSANAVQLCGAARWAHAGAVQRPARGRCEG